MFHTGTSQYMFNTGTSQYMFNTGTSQYMFHTGTSQYMFHTGTSYYIFHTRTSKFLFTQCTFNTNGMKICARTSKIMLLLLKMYLSVGLLVHLVLLNMHTLKHSLKDSLKHCFVFVCFPFIENFGFHKTDFLLLCEAKARK